MRECCRAISHGGGCWRFVSIFHYDLIRNALSDYDLWSSRLTQVENLVLGDAAIMIQDDPPKHTHYKALLYPWITTEFTRKFTSSIREHARAMVAEYDGTSCDFVECFAASLATWTMCGMLGMPYSDGRIVREFTNEISDNVGLEFLISDEMRLSEQALRIGKIHARFTAFLRDVRKTCLAVRTSGLIAVLAQSSLSEAEQLGLLKALAFAGNHTSTILQTNAVWLFGQFPDEYRKMIREKQLIEGAVEEILRYKGVFRGSTRIATRSGSIGGVDFSIGDYLIAWTTSGNWDEKEFAQSSCFDISRYNQKHLSFGHGPHYCIGSHIARMQLRALLEAFLFENRFPVSVGEPELIEDPWVDGFKSLQVQFQTFGGQHQ